MGITEAKKYIRDLKKRQKNPFLWPDFLTGLPDKTAILAKLENIFPKLGSYSVAYARISNVQPYLIKYGPDRHAEIIQWAAAILKTSADSCSSGFVGTLNTHDFMVVCKSGRLDQLMEEASTMFRKCMRDYYSDEDLKNKSTIAFRKNNGKDVKMGLMSLVYVVADKPLPAKKSDLVLSMARVCDTLEKSEHDMVIMTKDMLYR